MPHSFHVRPTPQPISVHQNATNAAAALTLTPTNATLTRNTQITVIRTDRVTPRIVARKEAA